MGLYLMGKIKFAHDSDVPHIGVFRLVPDHSFIFTLPYTWFRACSEHLLTRLSGLAASARDIRLQPPESDDRKQRVSPAVVTGSAVCETPKYSDILNFEYGLEGYFDLEQGLACAEA
ncbi:MAG: hypothetical protein MZU84_07155 [Sphingobacterium sp.]|nr:hypothetical protein [Sphingobacterium sp.]